ncbi:neurosecretory protein VGF-like [Bombina bombina]|uniref:neurosecretory protein VGF-like n=1 Tax=Bombina bombina TaxID=8345 RepID=UPI00235A803D|nr:neurosecretory protein VGF-like [Bombina bombina]
MFQASSIFLFLFLNIIHVHIVRSSPLGEEQRHQTIHRMSHSEPTNEHLEQKEVPLLSQSEYKKADTAQERDAPLLHPPAAEDQGDELFKDISPKALAAVLLQALNVDGGKQSPPPLSERKLTEENQSIKDDKEDDDMTERVNSWTRSSEKEGEVREDEKMVEEEDLDSVKSLLKELEGFETPPKREKEPPQDSSSDNNDLEVLRELLGLEEQREEEKRSAQKTDPKTPKQLEGEEEGEKLAEVAQDMLLQYLLNGGENVEDQDEDEKEKEGEAEEVEDYLGSDFVGGQRPLFEDEEEENVQEKRSKEDDGEEVDPQTIDKLIELSSRLHLPADDVVDIISDVEKRKRRKMKKKKARDEIPSRKERTRTPPQSWPEPPKPKPAYYSRRRLEKEQSWNKVPDIDWNKASGPSWNKIDPTWNKVSEPSWNKIQQPSWNKVKKPSWNKVQQPTWNKVQQSNWNSVYEPTPRRYRTRPATFPNYIRPRAFQTLPRYYYKPPSPQRNDYFDEEQDRQEEMENYIERILLTHPEVFQ